MFGLASLFCLILSMFISITILGTPQTSWCLSRIPVEWELLAGFKFQTYNLYNMSNVLCSQSKTIEATSILNFHWSSSKKKYGVLHLFLSQLIIVSSYDWNMCFFLTIALLKCIKNIRLYIHVKIFYFSCYDILTCKISRKLLTFVCLFSQNL